jgi:hypothetical protein
MGRSPARGLVEKQQALAKQECVEKHGTGVRSCGSRAISHGA